jgi:hypothetical protein
MITSNEWTLTEQPAKQLNTSPLDTETPGNRADDGKAIFKDPYVIGEDLMVYPDAADTDDGKKRQPNTTIKTEGVKQVVR